MGRVPTLPNPSVCPAGSLAALVAGHTEPRNAEMVPSKDSVLGRNEWPPATTRQTATLQRIQPMVVVIVTHAQAIILGCDLHPANPGILTCFIARQLTGANWDPPCRRRRPARDDPARTVYGGYGDGNVLRDRAGGRDMTLTSPWPPSRGVDRVVCARIQTSPIDLGVYARAVEDPTAGATVTFSGEVRDHDHGRRVVGVDYSCHPTAEAVLDRIAVEVAESFPGVRRLAVGHRIGSLGIGDIALCAVVNAAHRSEAFQACAALVETVKRDLPLWKLQFFADGQTQWVYLP